MAGPIRISILADDKASRAFASVGANAGGMGVRVGKAGKALGVAMAAGTAIAAAAALKLGADSVKAASAAQQSLGATETVFGRYAKAVVKRSNEAATAIGISANEYRELSNVVGASLTGAGLSIQKASVLTGDLNSRAADMAATFGGTTREAVEAVSSALRGETDPIERYGVSIKQADVTARLAAQGQDKLTGAALKSAEMQARLDLIFSKTSKTQGAFARESNTLAHQQQVLGAQWENLKAKVGSALLPVLTRLLTVLNANLMPAFAAVSAAVGPVVARIKEFFDGAGEGQGKLSALSAFLQTQVVPAVQSVITAYQGLIGVVLPIISQIADAVISGWSQIQPQVQSIWGSVKNIIVSALNILRSVVKIGTGVIAAIWSKFGGDILRFITTTMKNVATFLKGAFQIIEGIFKTVSALLRGDWKGAWDGIKKIAEGAVNVVKGAVSQAWNMIRTATSVAWTAIKTVVAKAWDGLVAAVKAGVRKAVDFVRGLPGKITSAIGDLGSLLLEAGRSLIQGLIDGIGDKVGDLTGKLSSITDKIPDWKGPADRDARLLRPAGQLIMRGLVDGIDDGVAPLAKKLDDVTTKIRERLEKQRDQLKSVLDGLKSDFASLADSVAGAFTGNLFDATAIEATLADINILPPNFAQLTPEMQRQLLDDQYALQKRMGTQAQSAAQVFVHNLLGTRGQLRELGTAFRKLANWGLEPRFLSQLFASGNGGLILDLAKGRKSQALRAEGLFGQVTSLSSKLGKQVARSELGPKIDRTNNKLDQILGQLRNRSPRDSARRTTAERAPSAPAARPSSSASKNSELSVLVQLVRHQIKLLERLIRVESDAPIAFGQQINRAAVAGYRRRL